MGASHPTAPEGAHKRALERLERGIARRLRLFAAEPDRIGHAASRPADETSRRDDPHLGRETDPDVREAQRVDQRLVLAERPGGKAADPAVGGQCDAQARAGDRTVMGPGIVVLGIEQRADLDQLPSVSVFKRAARVQRGGQPGLIEGVEFDVARDRFSAGLDRREIVGDPGRGDPAVRVGRQDEARRAAFAVEPARGALHRKRRARRRHGPPKAADAASRS